MDDPQDQPAQNTPDPANQEPLDNQPANDQPAPSDDGGQPAPANDDAQPTPGDQGDGQQPSQQSRQERRDQERANRGIGAISNQFQQGQQPYQQQPGGQQSPQFPQYQPGQEVSPEQLQQDVVQTASAIANLQVQNQLQHRDAVHNFERDTDSIPVKFKELNPDPDNAAYVPELDEAIAQEYQERAFKVVGYDNQGRPVRQLDTSVRLSDIAERQVRAARAYAAKSNASMSDAVAASADSSAPRPTGAKPTEKAFKDLTLDEMRARVGYHKT